MIDLIERLTPVRDSLAHAAEEAREMALTRQDLATEALRIAFQAGVLQQRCEAAAASLTTLIEIMSR